MMDIYIDNKLLECNIPDAYSLQIMCDGLEENVGCNKVAVLLFDTGYLLKMQGAIQYMNLENAVSIRLYRGEQIIMEASSVDISTKEGTDIYRLFCKTETVGLCTELFEKQKGTGIVQTAVGNEQGSTLVSLQSIEAIYEKYFANQIGMSVMAERRKMRRRAISQDGEQSIDFIMGELDRMIGLGAVKFEVKKMVALEKNREFLDSIEMKDRPNDMLFLGNPGTGKTTVARYLTEVLYKMGKIQENKCVEINGHDLTGGYVGQTASTVDRHLMNAKGGVLFIDEAYSLLDGSETYASDAITKLLGALTKPNRDFVCILAGYEQEMNELMRFNAGFESRVATKLHFEDYTVEELGEIFCGLIKNYGYSVEKDALVEVMKYFASVVGTPKFSNGRFVRNLFEKMEEEHCKHFDGADETSDVFRVRDLTDEIKQQLLIGIM